MFLTFACAVSVCYGTIKLRGTQSCHIVIFVELLDETMPSLTEEQCHIAIGHLLGEQTQQTIA